MKFSEGIKWNTSIIFVLTFVIFRDYKKHTLKQSEKIGGTFLNIVTLNLQMFTCIYFVELKIFCIFADSKFLEGLWDLNIFMYHEYSKYGQIQWDNNKFWKKNNSKNGTAGFEVNMTSYYKTIFTFITINVL